MYTETVKQTVMLAKAALTKKGVETDTALEVAMLAISYQENYVSFSLNYTLKCVKRSLRNLYRMYILVKLLEEEKEPMLEEEIESFVIVVSYAAYILQMMKRS